MDGPRDAAQPVTGVADEVLAAVTDMASALSIADVADPAMPLIYVNPAFERLTGYASAEAVGRNGRFMQGPDTDPTTVRSIRDGLLERRVMRHRLVNYRADGSAYWADLHLSPVHDADGTVTRYVAISYDATAEVLDQDRAVHAATRDELTRLMNRSAFASALAREIARAQRYGTSVGVLFLDVDDFKGVNDRYGHVVGDAYLVYVADCLRNRLRGDDAAARVGGDEFIVLVADLPADGAASAAAAVVDDLSAALGRPFLVDGVEHRVSVSIGTALHPQDGSTVRELVAASDAAMYRRKAERPGTPPGGGRGTA